MGSKLDSRIRKSRPLMLKDFLKDDLSSCSSNGFRSYPRRQCCTTVRNLLEIDLRISDANSKKNKNKKLLLRSHSKATSSTASTFQKASVAVINAVKHLHHFYSVTEKKKPVLPRSFSRKLLSKSFWRKSVRENEIQRWKTFRDLLVETQKPLDLSSSPLNAATSATSATTTTASTSNSWSESDFSSSCENDVVVTVKTDLTVTNPINERVGGDSLDSTTSSSQDNPKKHWMTEEKEQFSPVSVLDCPFEDDDDVCSSFDRSLARMQGTKQKLMKKIRRFENLADIEPVNLTKQISLSDSDDDSLECTTEYCSKNEDEEDDEEMGTDKKARELLKRVKTTVSLECFKLKAENTLLDFFRENVEFESEASLLKTVEDWMYGRNKEMLDWGIEDNRCVYIRDMEKGGVWRDLKEEKDEVSFELETGVLNSLVDELVLDFFASS